MTDDPLAIPDFLRVFNIRKDVLDAATKAIGEAGDEELAQKLRDISIPPRFKEIKTEPQVADIPTNKKIRLTRKLKEDTAIRICQLINDGHNTYARLKKIISDERVLKSSLKYGLTHNMRGYSHRESDALTYLDNLYGRAHNMRGVKIVKTSLRTYGVERRKK